MYSLHSTAIMVSGFTANTQSTHLVHPSGTLASDSLLDAIRHLIHALVHFAPVNFDQTLFVGDLQQDDCATDGECRQLADLKCDVSSYPNGQLPAKQLDHQ